MITIFHACPRATSGERNFVELNKALIFLEAVLAMEYVWKFMLALLQNHHKNTTTTRRLWQIKVGYDLLNQLGSHMNIMQFQINSNRKPWQRDTWVIKIRVLEKYFWKQFWFIRTRRQLLRPFNRFTAGYSR